MDTSRFFESLHQSPQGAAHEQPGTVQTTPASYLREDLHECTAGLVADPHFVFGAERCADGLELSVDRLVREGLDSQLRFAGRVQLQVLSQYGIRETLQVHEESAEMKTSHKPTAEYFIVNWLTQVNQIINM